jgi:hypothetical protein
MNDVDRFCLCAYRSGGGANECKEIEFGAHGPAHLRSHRATVREGFTCITRVPESRDGNPIDDITQRQALRMRRDDVHGRAL